MSGTTKTNLPSRNPRRSGIVIPNKPTGSQRLVAILVWVITNTIAATVRFRIHDPHEVLKRKDFGPAIYCAWHNRLALSIKAYFRYSRPRYDATGVAALVSASKDGALLADIFQRFGVQPVRGSSSRRGAQALLELSTWAERGYDIAITPDGPRGPRYEVAGGAMALAHITGLPIVPSSYYLNWKIQVKSWDKFQIPLPFTRCEVTVGRVMYVPRESTDDEREVLRRQLETELRSITHD
jgi:lysophospholipid acyltransferase (LPLAT)-like uncharacterized protein